MNKGTELTLFPGSPGGMVQVFTALLAIVTCSLFWGCGKEELAEWQIFAQEAGEEINGLDAKIKAQEAKFEKLGKKWEEQIGLKTKFYSDLEQNVAAIAGLTADIRNLEQKLVAIAEAIEKAEPYTGKTGQVYKPSELEQLTMDVEAEIERKKDQVREKRKYAEGFERYSAGSWEHQS